MSANDSNCSSEIWKDVPGYEGRYQVSNVGRVKSLDRIVCQVNRWGTISKNRLPGRIRKLTPTAGRDNQDYLGVALRKQGKKTRLFLVHRLVLETFVGRCPKGKVCCHADGDSKNNRVENLRWGTRSENEQDKLKHGTYFVRARNFKLSGEEFDAIKRLYATGRYSQRSLGKMFGVTHTAVKDIAKGRVGRKGRQERCP